MSGQSRPYPLTSLVHTVGPSQIGAVATWMVLVATVVPVTWDAPALTMGILGISAVLMIAGLRSRGTIELALAAGLVVVAYARGLAFTDGTDGAAPLVALALVAHLLALSVAAEPPVTEDAGRRAARRRAGALWLTFTAAAALVTATVADTPSRAPAAQWTLGLVASMAALTLALAYARSRLPGQPDGVSSSAGP